MGVDIPAIPPDPGLPGVRGLLGQRSVDLADRFFRERGWRLRRATPVQAMYRPGRSLTVRLQVEAETGGGSGHHTWVCLKASAEPQCVGDPVGEADGLPDPVGVLDEHLVWAFAADPRLPGLSSAASPRVAKEVAQSVLGPVTHVTVRPLRYRPGQRAVLRYLVLRRGPARRWEDLYVKVMDEEDARHGMELAGILRGESREGTVALPAARPFADTLVFTPAPGKGLRDLLVDGGSLPDPARVVGLAADLASWGDLPMREAHEDPGRTARRARRLLTAVAPHLRREVEALAATIEEAASQRTQRTVVHGDLYEGQILVDDDYTLRMVDIDDLGWGDPVLDAATFTAHLVALAESHPAARDRILAYRRILRRGYLEQLGATEGELAWREALIMLTMATGPFRVLDPNWPQRVEARVGLARWLLQPVAAAA